MEKPVARIEEWKLVHTYEGRYFLAGKVYDHPSYVQGRRMATGKLIALDDKKMMAETRTAIYKLGAPKE